MFRHLFLVACISFGGRSSEEELYILARIPEIIENFCPGVNVCRENQSSPAPEKTFAPGSGPCCTDCSCGTDCMENGNCCFPHKQSHQHDDSNGLDILPVEHDCLFPSTTQITEDYKILHQSYCMVSAVHEHIPDGNETVSNIPCGDENVAPWGSLYPVYSAKHSQIYKNMACANALGVTDGVLWDAVLACGKDMLQQTDVSTSVLGLDSNLIPEYCTVHFSYPDDKENLQSLICYVSPIDTCSGTEFQIPDGTGISKKDVTDLCTSGFLSPYRAKKLYANVFCHICNAESFRKEMVCRELLHSSSIKSFQRGFVGLIDGEFVQSKQKENFGNGRENPMACSFADTSRCRPVLCPSGQLRDFIGKCKYPNKIWYDQEYTVYVNLTSKEAISIAEVFSNISSALTSPWPKSWIGSTIYGEVIDETRKYKTLIVPLKNNIYVVRPHNLMQRVKKFIMQDWLLQMHNTTIVLKSTFTVTTTKVYLGLNTDSYRETQTPFGNNSINFTSPSFHTIYPRLSFKGNAHLITKLYLCHQVELIQSDFILSADKTMLFNTITQRVMFDSEFILMFSNSVNSVRARICIEDSGMYQMDKHALPNSCALSKIIVLRFTVAALMSRALCSTYIF